MSQNVIKAGGRYAGIGAVCLLSSLICVISAPSSFADIMLTEDHWNTSAQGWESNRAWATSPAIGPGGVTNSGWLSVTAPVAALRGFSGAGRHDAARVPPANIFAGAVSNPVCGRFDFWAPASPSLARIKRQWRYTADTNVWGYALTTGTNLNTLTESPVQFVTGADREYPGAALDEYLSDLNSSGWIGAKMLKNTGPEPVRKIDHLQLLVPEPAEISLLAAAIIASIFAVRLRRHKRSTG